MQEQFAILEKVQEVDLQIDDLLQAREHGPEEITNLDQELAKHHITLLQEIQKEEKLRADLNKKQEQFSEETLMIKKKQDRAAEIRNQKEYQANMREIESSRMELAILEEDMKIIQDRLGEHEVVLKEAREKYEAIAAEINGKRVEIESKLSNLDKELAVFKEKRNALAKKCHSGILGRYDRVRRRAPGGVGLLRITQPSCPNCHMSIPPQQFNEIIRMERLMVCGSCQLLHYWKEEGNTK